MINRKNVLAGNDVTANLEIGGAATAVMPQYGWPIYSTVMIDLATGHAAVHWSTPSGGSKASRTTSLGKIGNPLKVAIPKLVNGFALNLNSLTITQE